MRVFGTLSHDEDYKPFILVDEDVEDGSLAPQHLDNPDDFSHPPHQFTRELS